MVGIHVFQNLTFIGLISAEVTVDQCKHFLFPVFGTVRVGIAEAVKIDLALVHARNGLEISPLAKQLRYIPVFDFGSIFIVEAERQKLVLR